MFARRAWEYELTEDTTPQPAQEAQPTTSTPPRPKLENAADARCFQPSTFASRKAEAEAFKARHGLGEGRRLVSMGKTEFPQRDTRTGEVTILDATLYYDFDHPVDRFITIEGVPGIIPLNGDDQRRDTVTTLPPLRQHPRGPSALTPAAQIEPPPRPV